MKCKICHQDITDNSRFCNYCGAKLDHQGKTYPNIKCQRNDLPSDALFCPVYGTNLTGGFTSCIIIPSLGESITHIQVAKWLVADGESVEMDQEVVEIDSDKASLPLSAPLKGNLMIVVAEGETVPIGTVIAHIENNAIETISGITFDIETVE